MMLKKLTTMSGCITSTTCLANKATGDVIKRQSLCPDHELTGKLSLRETCKCI